MGAQITHERHPSRTIELLEEKRADSRFPLSTADQLELNTARTKVHEYDKQVRARDAVYRANAAAEEAAAKPLEEIAHEINSRLNVRERDIRLQKAFLLNLAFRRVCGPLTRLTQRDAAAAFKQWTDANISVSWKECKRLVNIARSPDPVAAMARHRKKGANRKRTHDEKERELRNDPEALIDALKKAVRKAYDGEDPNIEPDHEQRYERAEQALVAVRCGPEAMIARRWDITENAVKERLRITETDPVQAFRNHLLSLSRAQRGVLVHQLIEEFEITELELNTPAPVQNGLDLGMDAIDIPAEEMVEPF